MSIHICKHQSCDRTFVDEALLQDHADSVHTYSQIETAVRDAVRAKWNRDSTPSTPSVYAWVNDLTDTWVVFSVETASVNGLFQVDYLIDEAGTVTLGDAPVPVERRVIYVPVAAS